MTTPPVVTPAPITGRAYRKLREFVLRRDGWTCRHCGAALHHKRCSTRGCDHCPHVDHWPVARRHGGTSTPDNLVASCQRCNLGKGTDSHVNGVTSSLRTSRAW